MASTKREAPKADAHEHEAKKAKAAVTGEPSEQPSMPKHRVALNPANCDLDFNIEGNGLVGSALHEHGFAYCWSGARANVGVNSGKYCFGCKIIAAQPVQMEETPLDQQHVCRLGISRGDDNVGNLGETEHSFGYGGTGKFSNAGRFSDYGGKYGVGDTIICTVNLENKSSSFVGFSKNGEWLGSAKHFNTGSNDLGVVDSPVKKLQWESALFPHVLLKNVVVQLQFSVEDGLVPEEGYKPWASALGDGNAIIGPTFANARDCELMMMVGLPAAGKTTWAEKWVKEHPEKRYLLLGTNLALDKMKVPGLLRRNNYGERFERLMDKATAIFNTLLSRASKTPRNFIVDQTNVYKSARRRKLKPFVNYLKIAVVLFPRPEELKFRAEKRFREMGKEVPAEAVNEMLVNFVLPMSKDMPGADEYFDQVMFPELNREESQRQLDEMKRVNAESRLSPYSRETSVQPCNTPYYWESSVQSYNTPYSQESSISCYSPSIQSQGTSLGVTGGHWQSPRCSLPPLSNTYQNHGQENSAYLGTGPPVRTESYVGAYSSGQNPPALRDSPYGNYSSTPSYFPRNDLNPYGAYGGHDHTVRNDMENRIATSGHNPYQTYGVGETYNRSNVGADPYQSGSYGYENSGGYTTSGPSGPSANLQVPSQPTFPAPPANGYNNYSGYTTSVPRGPSANLQVPSQPTFPTPPATYDSPYGYSRPLGGHFPTDPQHIGGADPPRPSYY